ncbi:Protease [Dactylella cylindrospora]|nr:Protease [Dactylella cylindrospora]
MDFIQGLPSAKGYDMALIVTDKYSKLKKIVPGKSTWKAGDWSTAFYEQIYRHWGMPDIIITDRDPKFLSAFWNKFMSRARVKHCATTSYNPRSNGQAEISNQTVELALRYWLAERASPENSWLDGVPEIEFNLNNSVTKPNNVSPNEAAYGQILKSAGDLWSADSKQKVDRDVLRQEIVDACAHAVEYVRRRFNDSHKPPPQLRAGDYVFLNLKKKGAMKGYTLAVETGLPFKLDKQRIGPLKILEVVSPLAYRLDLPTAWKQSKMHNVISIAHLEPAPIGFRKLKGDPFKRKPRHDLPLPVTDDGHPAGAAYEVEKILKKAVFGRHKAVKYFVKWLGYPNEDSEWVHAKNLFAPELVKEFEEQEKTKNIDNSK